MKPTQAASLSVASNALLVGGKLAAGLAMGSVSVISEAIHSSLDLLAAIIALVSVSKSGRPPDERHRFGHGKIENVSALVEGLLIFIAAAWIVVEAVAKLRHGVEVEALGLGVAVMGVSAIVNFFISRMLFRVARENDSLALEADALHLRTDVTTSVGVLAGLLAIHFTGITILDPIIAIAVALLIVKAAWDLTRASFMPLLDHRLSDADETELEKLLAPFATEYIDIHRLRTRKAGAERHIDMHLRVDGSQPLARSHDVAARIEAAIQARWPRTTVVVHLDPAAPPVADTTADGS